MALVAVPASSLASKAEAPLSMTTHWGDDDAKIGAEVLRSSSGAHNLFGSDDPFAPAPPVVAALRAKIASKLCVLKKKKKKKKSIVLGSGFRADFGPSGGARPHGGDLARQVARVEDDALLPRRGGYADVRPARGHSTTGACTLEERQRYVDELVGALTGAKKRKRQKDEGKKAHEAELEAVGKRNVVAYDQKSGALVATTGGAANPTSAATGMKVEGSSRMIVPRRRAPVKVPEPAWHAPWKLASVVSGHLGWVRCCAFEPKNEWFVTGAADRTIKVWDLAKCSAGADGGLKLTLTGHINAIRGLAVSPRTTYMFSAGEDKKVMCWDLEMNKVVRHYHGHLSGVYSLCLHPTLDLLMTGGRDSVCRVWDIRTSKQVMVLGGHGNTVGAIQCNAADPQVITGSHDCTVKLWDLAKGRAMTTLTHHKKAIRDLAVAPFEFSFVTGAADNLKKWQCKDGTFLRNLTGHKAIINTVDVNADGVLCSGGDDGSIKLWDYKTGYNFQALKTVAQPGSLDCEAGVYMARFDKSGSRLVTCEADKSIKIWKEDLEASEVSHPLDMKSWTKECRMLKRF